MGVPRTGGLSGVLLGLALLTPGCGGEERPPPSTTPEPEHVREVERNPYAVTCGDIANQPLSPESSRLVIHAEFALAEVPELRETAEKLTRNRTGRSVYYAMTEICRGREGSFTPGRLAVEGVRSGKYRAAKNRPG